MCFNSKLPSKVGTEVVLPRWRITVLLKLRSNSSVLTRCFGSNLTSVVTTKLQANGPLRFHFPPAVFRFLSLLQPLLSSLCLPQSVALTPKRPRCSAPSVTCYGGKNNADITLIMQLHQAAGDGGGAPAGGASGGGGYFL